MGPLAAGAGTAPLAAPVMSSAAAAAAAAAATAAAYATCFSGEATADRGAPSPAALDGWGCCCCGGVADAKGLWAARAACTRDAGWGGKLLQKKASHPLQAAWLCKGEGDRCGRAARTLASLYP
jgi:hypothetical protein